MGSKPEALRLADVLGQTWAIGGYITEHDMKSAAAELRRQHTEIGQLRAFAVEIMSAWPEGGIDGAELESIAFRHGLLEPELKTEPCGEYCTCASDYGLSPEEWAAGITCYRKTALLKEET